MKLALSILVIGLSGVLAAVLLPDPEARSSGAVEVTQVVELRTLSEEVITRGRVEFPLQHRVFSVAGGRVTALEAEVGDVVGSGDVVLRVDGRPIAVATGDEQLWRPLQLGVEGSDVQILQRFLADVGLFDGVISGSFGESTRRALKEWQDSKGHPESSARLMPDDLIVLTQPGRIGELPRIGQVIAPAEGYIGLTERSPRLRARVTPSERLLIRAGQHGVVVVDATGLHLEAVVERTGSEPIAAEDGSTLYEVVLSLEDMAAKGAVVEGVDARVAIIVSQAEDVVSVPTIAIITDDNGQPAVQLTNGERREVVPIELGISDGAWTEVRSGLKQGDIVVLPPA